VTCHVNDLENENCKYPRGKEAIVMQEGGDRGKGPNKTGTQPKTRTRSPLKRNRTKTRRRRQRRAKSGTKKDSAWKDAAIG
jgi:hypothetical protein